MCEPERIWKYKKQFQQLLRMTTLLMCFFNLCWNLTAIKRSNDIFKNIVHKLYLHFEKPLVDARAKQV